jgi:hypothetical protein
LSPARKRDYAAEYARRQSLAKQRGHGSYYEQRIRGGSKAKPTAPRPSGAELARRRGHSKFGSFLRAVQPESMIAVGANLGTIERTKDGWENVPVIVYTPDGEEIEFEFDSISETELDWLLGELDALDVDYSPDYDLRSLAP